MKLLGHLQHGRGYTVEETSPGIYTVTGDIIPIQIIDSRKLPEEENLWLRSLSDRHDGSTLARLDKEISKKGKAARLQAYIDVIMAANYGAAKEAVKMSKKFDRLMEETGLAAKWEARGEERKSFSIAQKMVRMGLPAETVISATELDPEKVKQLYKV
jgi:hypothetical protein